MYRTMIDKLRIVPFVLGLLMAGLVAQALGQGNQPYRLNDKDVERIIRNIERQADSFRKSLDDALDKSHFNGRKREDEINAYVREFDRETKRLHDRFSDHKSTGGDVQSILDRAVQIDRFMSRNRLTTRAQNDWAALRASLDQLAQAYNVGWQWNGYSPAPSTVSELPYRLSDKEVERIIRNIESQSDRFRSSLDRALDRSRLNKTRREDDINAYVKDFYEETKRLRDHFNDHKSTSADVQSVLDRAARIDQFMRRYPLTTQAQNDWSALRTNLDELARTYNVGWGWTENFWPSNSPAVDLPETAVINVTDATNRRGYRISVSRDGRAEVSLRNSLTTRYVSRDLAERLFADLSAALPLSQLPIDRGCVRSVSFGQSIYITFAQQKTPDLSCSGGARSQVLRDDVAAITTALGFR